MLADRRDGIAWLEEMATLNCCTGRMQNVQRAPVLFGLDEQLGCFRGISSLALDYGVNQRQINLLFDGIFRSDAVEFRRQCSAWAKSPPSANASAQRKSSVALSVSSVTEWRHRLRVKP